jgi:hypothetical protein
LVRNSRKEKLRHSQRPKNGGGNATTQQCNGKIETSKKRKKKKKKKVTTGKAGIGPLLIRNLTLIQHPNSIQQNNSPYPIYLSCQLLPWDKSGGNRNGSSKRQLGHVKPSPTVVHGSCMS